MSKRKLSVSNLFKALTVFRPRQADRPTLQQQLDAMIPAELKWERQQCCSKSAYPACTSRSDPGDGVWSCCHGHENRLIHYRGLYPFKYLKCHACDHILCSGDRTSEILTPLTSIIMEPFEKRFGTQEALEEARYCRLCHSCGLTHRGIVVDSRIKFSTPCVCGQSSTAGDICFFIGTVDESRKDPEIRIVDLRLERVLAASQRYIGRQRTTPSAPPVSVPKMPRPTGKVPNPKGAQADVARRLQHPPAVFF
ncbi:hypothetical protein BDW02DRAFT_135029 [Decorospora gaudefroyi]|uniref:Probable double zinc ribbon domain-containing protein n=1 Tax=Decorospora gaudefroyi TaxID=184978 RepID=A0A6A5JXX3_9PLEO|nr:hypothetical protein BDW02DRAFT_135029 [Decorospora gaudefroyi]